MDGTKERSETRDDGDIGKGRVCCVLGHGEFGRRRVLGVGGLSAV